MIIDIVTPSIPERILYLHRLKKCIENIKLPPDVFLNHIIIESKETAGKNRNIALSKSKGDYIFYIDDDDIPLFNLICNRVHSLLLKNVPMIFWDATRYIQPNESDIHSIFPDSKNIKWKPGLIWKTFSEVSNSVSMRQNYPVGSYIVRSDYKNILWPESSNFGEDIIYNKLLTKEISKSYDQIYYVPEEKVIIIKHPLSTTYGGDLENPKQNMLWHLKK